VRGVNPLSETVCRRHSCRSVIHRPLPTRGWMKLVLQSFFVLLTYVFVSYQGLSYTLKTGKLGIQFERSNAERIFLCELASDICFRVL
jgi:hypothetical protein